MAPLHQPVKVKLGSETYTLPAKRLKVARQRRRDGRPGGRRQPVRWGAGRAFREVTGGNVDETVQPQVSYSKPAVRNFVSYVAKKVDRDPQDASISATGDSLNVVPAANGRALKQAKLTASCPRSIDRRRAQQGSQRPRRDRRSRR